MKQLLPLLLLLFGATVALAQPATINGTIVNERGEPLAGINVGLEGTTLGAATDLNGTFAISGVPSASEIREKTGAPGSGGAPNGTRMPRDDCDCHTGSVRLSRSSA